jgi:hypothetical protein
MQRESIEAAIKDMERQARAVILSDQVNVDKMVEQREKARSAPPATKGASPANLERKECAPHRLLDAWHGMPSAREPHRSPATTT